MWEFMRTAPSSSASSTGALQPIMVNIRLHNVSVEEICNWEAGRHLGIHQSNMFWFVPDAESL
jgi:hypothetical protein